MYEKVLISDKNELETYFNQTCKDYGVSCRVFSKNKYVFSDVKEQYLVFGVNGVPDHLNIKDIYMRNERSNVLFYPDYFVVKLDENVSPLGLVEDAVSYCKTVDFLKKIYREADLPLPKVLRGDEIGALKEYNSVRKNKNLPAKARAKANNGIKKFLKQEKTRSKFLKKWLEFYRSDKFDRKASRIKMFRDYSNRNSQITSAVVLHETNDDLKTTVINEHEFLKFKKSMAQLYPEVLYAVSELEVQNEGFDVAAYKNKPVDKIPSGAFGKLVTYEAFCEEREKRFATEGYAAINDLNPAYYETRQLTYKEIDEPLVASVLNTIRFAYAKSDCLQSVKIPDVEMFSFIDVPVEDMMNFVSLAKANKVLFYLDCFGKFGKANFETMRIVYNPLQDEIMKSIVSRMIDEKFKLSHIATSLDAQTMSLDRQINEANHLQLNKALRNCLKQNENKIEL